MKNKIKKIVSSKKKAIKEIKNKSKISQDRFTTNEVIIVIIVAMIFGLAMGAIITYNSNFSSVKGMDKFTEAYKDIVSNYYEDVNEEDLINAAIKGMIESLDDPHATYYNEEETEAFNQSVDGNYVGIGVTVQASVEDNKTIVVDMFENSPAKEAGIKINDQIIKVDDKDVTNMDINDLTDLIKGEANTDVKITVLRDGKEIELNVTRKVIDIPSVESEVLEENNQKIGYIAVSVIAGNTYKQFYDQLTDLEDKNIESLIIDFRGNPGGHLDQIEMMMELFLEKDEVLYQLETKGKKEKFYDESKTHRDYEIVVITNQASASAAELFAAAIKESYPKGTILGETTYGKGSVQQASELEDGTSFKYTIQQWLTPKGNSIDKKGIEPDVEIKLADEYFMDPSQENDNQLQEAIKLLIK